MSRRIKWTKAKLAEAYKLHKEFSNLQALADHLSKIWKHKVSSNAIQKSLSKHYFRYGVTTIGSKHKKAKPVVKQV